MGLASFLALLLAAATVVGLGWRGRPAWSAPYCRRCGYDLRGKRPGDTPQCPECGAVLSGKHAIAFTRGHRHRWGIMAWGIFIFFLPFLFAAGIGVWKQAQVRLNPATPVLPHQLSSLTTDNLIQYQLGPRFQEPWVWNELEQRHRAGELDPAQADAAIRSLAQSMRAQKPQGWNQPLHWADAFLRVVVTANVVTDATLRDFYEAYHGPTLTIDALPQTWAGPTRLSPTVEFGGPWANHGVPHRLFWEVAAVQIDGQLIGHESHSIGEHKRHLVLEETELLAGDHELTVVLDCVLIDPARIPSGLPSRLPRNQWPTDALRRWSVENTQQLNVLPINPRDNLSDEESESD